jgi:hypothetical protein
MHIIPSTARSRFVRFLSPRQRSLFSSLVALYLCCLFVSVYKEKNNPQNNSFSTVWYNARVNEASKHSVNAEKGKGLWQAQIKSE